MTILKRAPPGLSVLVQARNAPNPRSDEECPCSTSGAGGKHKGDKFNHLPRDRGGGMEWWSKGNGSTPEATLGSSEWRGEGKTRAKNGQSALYLSCKPQFHGAETPTTLRSRPAVASPMTPEPVTSHAENRIIHDGRDGVPGCGSKEDSNSNFRDGGEWMERNWKS
ncbi:hypothetical protein C8R44DRAFT_728619 [Mycena epipterygia]|nr:hypothetical protein C8R44DRAFT_728619 [Mycena epipterygia]